MRFAIATLAVSAAVLLGQEHVTVPLTDPNRAATVRVDAMHGDITIRGYDGKEIVVGTKESAKRKRSKPARAERDGLRRIEMGGASFNVEERENVVTISSRSTGTDDFDIQVPRNTILKVKSLNGEIGIEGIRGEIEASSNNGEVTMANVEGSVVAHSLNGAIKVVLNRVEPRPMSFTTMNGDIDVTMPADTRARLKLRNDRGEVYSDFEMKVQTAPNVEQGQRENGRYRVKFERTIFADINGGGPEMSFVTVNGEIKIRQKK